jgi:hypothetical protein
MTFWFYYLLFSQSILAFVLLVMFSLFTKKYMIALVASSLITIMTIFNWNILENIKSKPLTFLPERFIIIHYIEKNPNIFLWVYDDDRPYPITIQIPWTSEDSKKLAEGKEEMGGSGLEASVMRDGTKGGLLETYKFNWDTAPGNKGN